MIDQTGCLRYFHNKIPDRYLLCDGRAVNRGDYSELFKCIGTFFGAGDGSTTFNVPIFDVVFFRQTHDKFPVGTFLSDSFKAHIHDVTLSAGGEHSSHEVPYVGTGWWEAGGFGGEIEMGEKDWDNPWVHLEVSRDGSLHSHEIEISSYQGKDMNFPRHKRYLIGIKY